MSPRRIYVIGFAPSNIYKKKGISNSVLSTASYLNQTTSYTDDNCLKMANYLNKQYTSFFICTLKDMYVCFEKFEVSGKMLMI